MPRPSDTAIKQAMLDFAYMTKQVGDKSSMQWMLTGMAAALGWVLEDEVHAPNVDKILAQVRDALKERHIIQV